MFKLAINPEFWWSFHVAYNDDGETKQEAIDLKIKRMTREDVAALNTDHQTAYNFAKHMIVDWRVCGEDDKPLAFTPENLDKLLSLPKVPVLLFPQIIMAQTEIRIKNLSASGDALVSAPPMFGLMPTNPEPKQTD